MTNPDKDAKDLLRVTTPDPSDKVLDDLVTAAKIANTTENPALKERLEVRIELQLNRLFSKEEIRDATIQAAKENRDAHEKGWRNFYILIISLMLAGIIFRNEIKKFLWGEESIQTHSDPH